MKKNNLWYSIFFIILSIYAISCKSTQKNKEEMVNGIVLDASMNNITLVTETGDTINISTMDADPLKVGGVMIDDVVNITYITEKMENGKIRKASDLVITKHAPFYYIVGSWVEPNPINPKESQGIALNADGTASSIGMATLLFKNWQLENNHLLLTGESIGNKQTLIGVDTLQINKLDADSLILSDLKGNMVWQLSRTPQK